MARKPKETPPEPVKAVKAPKVTKAPVKAVETPPEPAVADGGGNIIDRSKYKYTAHKDVKTASGRASVDNGDPVAEALRGKTAQEVVELVTENGGTPNENWLSLKNQGLVRMAAGNVLRNLLKSNGFLKVNGKRIKAPAATEPEPAAETTKPTRRKAA
jgi:hypothetical protein